MKRLILTAAVFLSSGVGGMDLSVGQLELFRPLLVNDKIDLKPFRSVYFYPVCTLQTLARVACVNRQLSSEIGNISVYNNTDFKDVLAKIQSAWCCYGEAGCFPKIKLCFTDISQHEGVFAVRQDQLIAHWVQGSFRSKIWEDGRNHLIGKDELGHSILPTGDNYIMLKPSNSDSKMMCIDASCMKQKEGRCNNIMTIYSIGRDATSLNQEELDAFINNAIEKPLVVVMEKSLFGNEKAIAVLLSQFRKCSTENNHIIGDCLQILSGHNELYQATKKAVKEVHQEAWQKLDELKNEFEALMADSSNTNEAEKVVAELPCNVQTDRWQTIELKKEETLPRTQMYPYQLPTEKCLIQ